jgi:hypothetical protein
MKKTIPQTRDKRKAYFRLLLWITMKRGRSPTQVKNPRSNFGDEKTRRKDETAIKMKSIG